VNPRLNAVVEVMEESARAAAVEADERLARGEAAGPFHGVPFSIKDSLDVAGTRTTAGTLGLANAAISGCDATLVARLRAAGAIPLAKTNLPDLLFAFESDNLIFGRTNNPYDHTRTCGGSSGGEAALIAACGSPFGLGSDAAGSVRLPAHFCGIAAIKPTSGRLPRTGHVPPAGGWIEALWQIGPMARRVEDLIALMPLLIGEDGSDHTVVPIPLDEITASKMRIAFFVSNGIVEPEPEIARVVRDAAQALLDAGHHVEERVPAGIEQSYELEMKFLGPDGGDGVRALLAELGSSRVHPLLEGWAGKLEKYRTDVAGFAGYWQSIHEFRAAMHAFARNYDAILSPVCAYPAIGHGTSVGDDVFPGFSYTMTHNLTGWPAATVRCGQTGTGLPIGVQIAAHPWREDVALALARQLEERFGGWRPTPMLS
jgi:amidase